MAFIEQLREQFPVLSSYNPWWAGEGMGSLKPPEFKRLVFPRLYEDLHELKQMLIIMGPRRVGKTVLMRQMIESLLADGVEPERIWHFSFQDPWLVMRSPDEQHAWVGSVADAFAKGLGESRPEVPVYFFLDEIQRLDRWELHLKKWYDLGYPFRVVASGSATSPIFRKSRESLMGRVKDYRVVPFSFREFWKHYVLEKARKATPLELGVSLEVRKIMWSSPGKALPGLKLCVAAIAEIPEGLQAGFHNLLTRYMQAGGFPETYEMTDPMRRQEYLYDNQVQKVIYEDLVLAAEFHKPENVKWFYLSLLTRPGEELNIQDTARKIGASRTMLDKYLPLLEMTDLVHLLPRFSSRPLRQRRSHVKCYPLDLSLRNAVLKLGNEALADPTQQGIIAETLVFNNLRRWPEIVELSYFREKDAEVDFVVTLAPGRHLPVEVKFREHAEPGPALKNFMRKYDCPVGVLITKDEARFGEDNIARLPLAGFLMLFDW